MYFKRLELIGFKSFANRTRLKFEPGVTAIVGPNGCGKSNIADAIKWVLGEQSAKELRGSRMEDVVFNGTSNKEPINIAEVSLVLSNENKTLPIDYQEVTITRRLFRSGESEYLLNKTPVRLKDINDLLAGTGIGTSSYSIIEQGQIGQILSSKPEERRYIFEEASGITKFKLKKKEALRKLEHTENNLVRINDIINEVERQIKSIERQAKKAEKYKQEFEVLKDLELKYSSFQYKNINKEFKTVSLENKDFKKREEELLQNIEIFVKDVEASKDVLKDLNENALVTEKEITQSATSIDKNKHAIQLNKERIEELDLLSENLSKEIEILKRKLKNRKSDLENYQKELTHISSLKIGKEKELEDSQRYLDANTKDIDICQDNIKSSKSKILDFLASQTKLKNELIKLGADIQNRKVRLRRLKIEHENTLKEKISLDARLKDVEASFNDAKEHLASSNNAISMLNNEIENLEGSLNVCKDRTYSLSKTKETLKYKLQILTELVKRDEGFDKSVKAIKKEVRNIETAADVINVRPGYESAVACALGELAQALIVNTREEAYRLIDFVKRRNLGRASFLIQEDAIKLKSKTPKNISKECHSIMHYIRYDESYKNIIRYLFRDTYIIETQTEAEELFVRFKECRFITKNGYLREGPRTSEGAVLETDTSIIGRGDKIKNIEKEISNINLELEQNKFKENEAEKNLKNFRLELNQARGVLRNKESVLAEINAQKNSLLYEINKIDEEKMIVESEIEDVSKTLDDFTSKGEALNLNLNMIEDELTGIQGAISNYETEIKERSSLKQETMLKIANIRGELSSIKISHDNISSNFNIRAPECDDTERDIESKNNQANLCLVKIVQFRDEILRLEEENQHLENYKKDLSSRFSNLTDRKDIEQEEFNKKESILKEKEKALEIMRNTIRDTEIKLTEINYKRTSILERIKQSYNTDLDEIKDNPDEINDWDEIKDEIEELKQKIKNLGPVNLVAIEEHRELEERLSFLTRQRDDLLNAKDSLGKAIIKINGTTRKLFIETFQKVQGEFRNYFRMLFGGGHAEIFLLDERDILESGIEIVVRPPGKKLQNILLLSGGERALTAIALLFAIFKINPSPFCILDEIDAPLDDSNIDRFTRVLQEFIKMSQFILITHNKKTIQMADILYGITMAEKGISRIVSVKFADDKDRSDREEIMV